MRLASQSLRASVCCRARRQLTCILYRLAADLSQRASKPSGTGLRTTSQVLCVELKVRGQRRLKLERAAREVLVGLAQFLKDCLAGGGLSAKLLGDELERYLSQDAESATAPGKSHAKRGSESRW